MSSPHTTFDMASKSQEYHSQRRQEMLAFVPRTAKKILEIGCGEGFFGESLKKSHGAEIWGVEMDPSAGALARRRIDNVLIGDVNAIITGLPTAAFDCVVFNDVLEHLADPYSILLRIKKNLSPDGVVVGSIPNIRYFYTLRDLLIKRQWKYEDDGILDKTHLRFFTQSSIHDMFMSLGYAAPEITGINPIRSWKLDLLNSLLFGSLSDTKFLQFACVARPLTTVG